MRNRHRRCSIKKAFLKISQNSQENPFGVYFFIKLLAPSFGFKNTFVLEYLIFISRLFQTTIPGKKAFFEILHTACLLKNEDAIPLTEKY